MKQDEHSNFNFGATIQQLGHEHLPIVKQKKYDPWKTETMLNRTNWLDGWGTLLELEEMDQDHLQNVLYYLYKNRDRLWLNCQDTSLIEKFKDGDEFFQNVIRNSTIWKGIIAELKRPEEGFNFSYTIPGE